MLHIIPEDEKKFHIEDACCPCEPVFQLDEESGEMIWLHKPVDIEKLIDQMVSF